MRLALTSVAAAASLILAVPPALAASNSLPPPDATSQVRPGVADYRIGPQDTLDISVDQLAELTKTVQVDTGGHILLPLIGQVQASGRTPADQG